MSITPDMMNTVAWEAENHMVPPEEWDSCGCPPECLAAVREGSNAGVPSGIARHPVHGWVGLESSGQGPYLIWWEGMPT